jgi:hypothetical protein
LLGSPRVTDHIREACLVGGLTAAALILRFLGLAEGDFWADELATRLAVVDLPPGDVLVAVQDNEGAPHLYYLLAWAWTGVLGAGDAALRSLSAIAGALVAPVAYLTVRQVGLRTEALIAGALAAASPLLIWYSQEARVYSLFALLTAVALLFFVRVLVDFDKRALVGWSIASAAAFLTHYFALFTIAGMAAVLLYRHRARWQSIALALLPTAVAAFALWPAIAAQRPGDKTDWISQTSLSERLLQVPEHFLTGLAYPPLAVVLVAGLLAAAGAAGVMIHGQRGRLVGGGLLAVLAVTVGLPLLALAVDKDFVLSRYLLGAIVPLLLAVGVGLGASRLRPAGPIIALALVALLAGTSIAGEYDHDVERPSWGAADEAIAEGGKPDMVVACCGVPAGPAQHYLDSYLQYDPGDMGEVEVREVVLATIRRPDHRPENDFCWWGAPCQAEDVLFPGGPANPDALSDAFASTFDLVETTTSGSIKLERFRSSTPVPLGPETPISFPEGDRVVVDDDIVHSVEVRLSP